MGAVFHTRPFSYCTVQEGEQSYFTEEMVAAGALSIQGSMGGEIDYFSAVIAAKSCFLAMVDYDPLSSGKSRKPHDAT